MCIVVFVVPMHISRGKCGMATTGRLLDHCTQLSNCKNPLVHHTQCQYARGGHVPVIQSIANTPVVAMSHIHCPTDNTPVVAMPPSLKAAHIEVTHKVDQLLPHEVAQLFPHHSASTTPFSFYHTIVRFGLKAATSKQPPHEVAQPVPHRCP